MGPTPNYRVDQTLTPRTHVRESVAGQVAAGVLDGQAKRVRGIVSWQRYLEVLLDAARKR